MDNHRHFEAWLRLVRRFDWSPGQREASALRAFGALQRAASKCQPGVPPAGMEPPQPSAERRI